MKVTRRGFIKTTTAVAVGVCACGLEGCFLTNSQGDTPEIRPPAYEIQESSRRLDIFIDKAPELLSEGHSVKIIDSRLKDSLIIVNGGDKGFRVLSIRCTHNNFEVEYKPEEKLFRCISWNHAEFSLDGDVIDGPTEKRLACYPVELQNDKLSINLMG